MSRVRWWSAVALAASSAAIVRPSGAAGDEVWFLGDEAAPGGGVETVPAGGETDGAAVPVAAEEGEAPASGAGPPPALGELLGLDPEAPLEVFLAALASACGAPSLAEALEAAVAGAGLDPGAEEGIVDRARWAALLPRLRVTFRRDWEHDESLDLEPDPLDGRYGIDTDDDMEVGLTAQWELADLVAPSEETTARRLALEAEAARRALRREVTEAYFDRCRLRLEWSALDAADVDGRAALAWEVARATARLDALTGGLFRRVSGEDGAALWDARWSSARIGDTK